MVSRLAIGGGVNEQNSIANKQMSVRMVGQPKGRSLPIMDNSIGKEMKQMIRSDFFCKMSTILANVLSLMCQSSHKLSN